MWTGLVRWGCGAELRGLHSPPRRIFDQAEPGNEGNTPGADQAFFIGVCFRKVLLTLGREDFRKLGKDDLQSGRAAVRRGGRHGHVLRRGDVLWCGRLGHGFRRDWNFHRRCGQFGPESEAPEILQGRGAGTALLFGQFGDIKFGVVARVVRLVDGHGVSPWLIGFRVRGVMDPPYKIGWGVALSGGDGAVREEAGAGAEMGNLGAKLMCSIGAQIRCTIAGTSSRFSTLKRHRRLAPLLIQLISNIDRPLF